MLKKIFRFIFSLYAIVVFVAVMLLLFPFALLTTLFGKVKGGNMIYNVCRVWADVVLFFWMMPHKNYYDAPKSKDHAVVFVFNHISHIDIPFLLKVFSREHIRVLGKAELQSVPVFGTFYKMAAIPVNRKSVEDRAKSMKIMMEYLKMKTSIVMAPEGTFNETGNPLKDFYDGAFKIAIETQTNIQPVLLLDGFNRMPYGKLFSINPGRSRAHFLPEVEVEGLAMADVPSLKQKVFTMMEDGLVQYNASWIGKPKIDNSQFTPDNV